ncbi:MAG: PadR family transcriptional regulator [Candidatus Odinarchaeota archaeon]
MNDADAVTDFKRFVGPSLLALIILSVLKMEGTSSGYAIIQKIKKMTANMLALKAGTVYPMLETMESKKFISKESITVPYRTKDGYKTKSVYKLTEDGKEVLYSDWNQWEELQRKLSVFTPEEISRWTNNE